jgi:hypothetical protein
MGGPVLVLRRPRVLAALSVSALLAAHRPSAALVALEVSAFAYAGWAVIWVTGRQATISAQYILLHPWTWLPYTVMVLGGVVAIWMQHRDSDGADLTALPGR